jgi:hypothetical protein
MSLLKTIETGPTDSIKRILVLSYSQSGQLAELTKSILGPLEKSGQCAIHIEHLRPVHPYPFPWRFFPFLDAFPESAHMVAPQLQPLTLSGEVDFDLVIVPYQVWFLAPSPPVTAFLKHPLAKKLLAGKPVVTVIACRNMWMLAQEKMKSLLAACGARMLDNIVLVDPGPTIATFFTTPAWLLTGRRDFFSGFPPAGLDAASIQAASRFGYALRDALQSDLELGTAPMLTGLRAVDSNPHLLVSEKAGTRSFYIWGKLLRAVGEPGQLRRRPFLILYLFFLIALIVSVVPLSLLVQALLRPLLRRRLAAVKQKYDAPSGPGTERMSVYEQ